MYISDFILNGRAVGPVAEAVAGMRYDPNLMRPYIDSRGQRCVSIANGLGPNGKTKFEKRLIGDLMAAGYSNPVYNATQLRKEEWIQLDTVVLKAARARLRAWGDLAAANSYSLNGMSTMMLEHETMSDPGEAQVDLDGLSEDRNDAPLFQLEGVPLPITHAGFFFSQRRLAMSRNLGTPLDTMMAEAAGRRVAESIEKTLIGTITGITYGGGSGTPTYSRNSSVYGYTNFPPRLTKTNLTTPTGSNPEATVVDILAMRDQMYANNFYGPFMIYTSTDWDKYMDNDYARLGGNNASQTLRQRLMAIEGISGVRRLDYLNSSTNPFTLIMVQMTSDVARAVMGMPLTTIQWEAQGGLRLMFKVMCIMVPQLRADFYGKCGILHATTS